MEKKSIEQFLEFSSEKFTKRVIFKDGNSTVFILNFQPGQSLPKHKHPGTNVYIHVLSGEGSFDVDEDLVAVNKGDILLFKGNEELSFVNNGSSNVSLYVMLNNLPSEQYSKDI